MIDLHLHTTASDGALTPSQLIERAAGCGITILSITDHDTTAGVDEGHAAADRHGLTLVPGIEITAVEGKRDVHLLGYFLDPRHPTLSRFLVRQRADRLQRLIRIGARLSELGCAIDTDALVQEAVASGGRSIGRPRIADALVAAGHARDREDAFARLLGSGCPAFIPRCGEPPEAVIAVIRQAGGIASLAHPVHLKDDAVVRRVADAGLSAIEVRHRDHSAVIERHYRDLADRHGLAVTGGSDFHDDHDPRGQAFGTVTLPQADYDRLRALVA